MSIVSNIVYAITFTDIHCCFSSNIISCCAACFAQIEMFLIQRYNSKASLGYPPTCNETVIYRHPNHQFDNFEKDLNELLSKFNLNNNEYIITGDFNIDLLESTPDNKLGQNLESHGCKPLITEPTRFSSTASPSLLDHIYCKLRNTKQIAGIAAFDVSGHLPIFLLLSTSINRKSEKEIIRCMKNCNLKNFLIDLDEAYLHGILTLVQQFIMIFMSLFIFFKQ